MRELVITKIIELTTDTKPEDFNKWSDQQILDYLINIILATGDNNV